jgi:hypothetical protein
MNREYLNVGNRLVIIFVGVVWQEHDKATTRCQAALDHDRRRQSDFILIFL